jgi:FkbM family methyltransferase
VDVGASGGVQSHWLEHSRHLRVIGFEPDARAFEKLLSGQDDSIKYLNTGLHSSKGQVDFYLTRKQQVSSCFEPNRTLLERFHSPERFDIIRKVSIQCITLDEALREQGITDIDFLKLDTQGSELAILQGASQALTNSIFGLEIEVAFAELYKGQPLFSDVDQFLRPFGFDLIDLRTVSWKRSVGARVGNSKGQLMFADALYFRRPIVLRSALENMTGTLVPSKLLHAISICQLYGFFDYALELLDIVGSDIFDEGEIQHLLVHLKSETSLASRLPNFLGREHVAELFLKLSQWLAPRRHKAESHPRLGNF